MASSLNKAVRINRFNIVQKLAASEFAEIVNQFALILTSKRPIRYVMVFLTDFVIRF